MTQLIIGLGNKARHGKDSFAAAVDGYYARINAAAAKHGMLNKPVIVQHHAFADALYREVNAFLKSPYGVRFQEGASDLTVEDGFDIPSWVSPDPNPEKSARAPYGKHPKLLQWWGTEFRRTQDKDYWVDQWKAGISPKANIVLATDMRFLNEAWAVQEAGGFTVRVSRFNLDGTSFVDSSRPSNHVSEVDLDDYNFDYQISVKTGDLVLLEEYAVTLVHYLRARKG